MKESAFQAAFIKDLRRLFPGCVVLKNDPNYLAGFPDLMVLYGTRWAALEMKKGPNEKKQPNQEHYVEMCLDWGAYSAFVFPENAEEVLRDLQQAFRA